MSHKSWDFHVNRASFESLYALELVWQKNFLKFVSKKASLFLQLCQQKGTKNLLLHICSFHLFSLIFSTHKTEREEASFLQHIYMSLATITQYSKSRIFVQKFNFDKTPTFSWVLTQFFFWQFFSWNQTPKPQNFHEFSLKILRKIILRNHC